MLRWMYLHYFHMNQTTFRSHIYEMGALEVPAGSTCLHVAVALMRHPQLEYILKYANHSFVAYKNGSGQTARSMISLLPSLERAEITELFESWEQKQAAHAVQLTQEEGDARKTASTSVSRASDTMRTGFCECARAHRLLLCLLALALSSSSADSHMSESSPPPSSATIAQLAHTYASPPPDQRDDMTTTGALSQRPGNALLSVASGSPGNISIAASEPGESLLVAFDQLHRIDEANRR